MPNYKIEMIKKAPKDLNAEVADEAIRKSRFPLVISAAVVVLVLAVYAFIPEVRTWISSAVNILASNDQVGIKSWIGSFSWFGPVLLVLAMVAQMFLVVVPTTALLVVCILAYGPVWGSTIALVAMYAASSAGYLIGRAFGSFTVERILGSKAKGHTTVFLEKYGFWAVFITRLNPFLSNDVVSLVSGMIKMDYWKFTAASLAGITPLILLIAVLGENTEHMLFLLFLCSAALLILFFGISFYRRKCAGNSGLFRDLLPVKPVVPENKYSSDSL